MKLYHKVRKLEVKGHVLFLEVDGKSIDVSLKHISSAFIRANREELQKFELSPSGYGIHWPLLNEDVSIDALLGITHSPEDAMQAVSF